MRSKKAQARDRGADATKVGENVAPEHRSMQWNPVAPGADLTGLRFMVMGGHSGYFYDAVPLGDGLYSLMKINVTNFWDRKAVPNGSWMIVPSLITHSAFQLESILSMRTGCPNNPATTYTTRTSRHIR